ncbi:enoyl-CoA hydratase [Saccharopolyspora sp. WRP15-2]|uniref:Enoyl-CoA hydratase n=1 Tax=Saccharopolyspora oryzae TaxID=2997343 RepID=A0ABT4UX86_9PSEU|nr:enoyl-CoA hydratase [Saccharopolyspora oryzae]MDA3626335.1 enoyl-CoA hydratase [Saccharopolyspora oryzae]
MNEISNTEHATGVVDDDGIATVTIRNAKVLNIVNSAVSGEVTAAIAELAERPEVRALVLRGTGDRAFIGGADITEMATLERGSAEVFIDGLRRLCQAVRDFPAPVIARMPGWCLGVGVEVAAACDLRISSSTAKFGMPEVAVGIPSVIHAALLPRLIGGGRADWLMLTAENIDAETALSWGLVNEVVALEELDDAVARTARRFAEFGPAAVRQQKKLLRSWEALPLDQAIADSVAEFGTAFDTGEPQKYMTEFLNRKRN